MALSAPIIAFVQLFSDPRPVAGDYPAGDRIDQGQLSFAFWLNVAAGAILAIVTVSLSPLVGWFYGDPRVVALTMVSGSLFLVGRRLHAAPRHLKTEGCASVRSPSST